MRLQTTTILLLCLVTGGVFSTEHTARPERDSNGSALTRIGHVFPRTTIEGTISLDGEMTIGNLPFSGQTSGDTISVSVQGPFGMMAGVMYATADTFVVVNYLSREVLVGHPDAKSVASVSPIPLTLTDIRAFMRGSLPGDLGRFQRGAPRSDSKLLFVSRDSSTTEYVLVDTAASILTQYQRKSRQGATLLNLVLGDVREVSSVNVAYAVDVDLNDKAQAVRFRFDAVAPSLTTAPIAMPEVPSSFTRRVYDR